MNEKIGHADFRYPANYSQTSYATQHVTRAEVASPISATHADFNYYNSAPSIISSPSRINENSAISHAPSYGSAVNIFSELRSCNEQLFGARGEEYMYKKAKESCETHQSKIHVDCESNTSDDEEKENNSDMDNNSVVLRTESNKECSEFIVSQETSLAVQNHSKSNKIAILDFSKAKGVIRFNSDYFAIKQHVLVEKCSSSEEHSIVRK